MRVLFASLIISLFAFASLSSALAQSVQTITFRVPVEVENIRYLSSVDVTCRIQDGTPAGSRGGLDMRLSHTIFNMVHIPMYPADHATCTAEPRSEQAMLLCPDSLGDGLSWSNVIDVPVQDFQGGGIQVADGANYVCKIAANYDTEPLRPGESTLVSGCTRHYSGFHTSASTAPRRERYQTYTGGDIAAARLCGDRTDLDTSVDVIDEPLLYIRGGEYIEPRSPSDAAVVSSLGDGPVIRMQAPTGLPTMGLLTSSTTACVDATQDTIAWDYNGSTHWGQGNLDRLCAGAETSAAPAQCFDSAMHGGVNWGSSTQWGWGNALDLCEGTLDADVTLTCFTDAIASDADWRVAIDQCDAQP